MGLTFASFRIAGDALRIAHNESIHLGLQPESKSLRMRHYSGLLFQYAQRRGSEDFANTTSEYPGRRHAQLPFLHRNKRAILPALICCLGTLIPRRFPRWLDYFDHCRDQGCYQKCKQVLYSARLLERHQQPQTKSQELSETAKTSFIASAFRTLHAASVDREW